MYGTNTHLTIDLKGVTFAILELAEELPDSVAYGLAYAALFPLKVPWIVLESTRKAIHDTKREWIKLSAEVKGTDD